MKSSRVTFRFNGTNQDSGQRHVQTGTMVEARNVRQLKAGEYRKRRGFDRIDPLETLFLDNEVYRRSSSVVYLGKVDVATVSDSLGAAEVIIGGGSGLAENNAAIPVMWSAFGASNVIVGCTGLYSVSSNLVALRVRIGGLPATRAVVDGTSVASATLNVGASQTSDFSSTDIPIPSAPSYLQVTADFAGGGGTLDSTALTPWISAVGAEQSMMVATMRDTDANGSEVVGPQWYVDFDRLDASYSNLVLGFCGRTFQAVGATGTYNVYLGGTVGAADGTLVLTYGRTTDTANDGRPTTGTATIVKPTGVQLVKVSVHSTGGQSSLRGMSLIMRGSV